MKISKKIIRLRKRQPLLTGSEIGRKMGVSRQYVSRILNEADLNNIQPTYKKEVKMCKVCGKQTPRGQQLCPIGKCKDIYFNVEMICAFCKTNYILKRGHVVQRYNRQLKNTYCSSSCYGRGQKDGLS